MYEMFLGNCYEIVVFSIGSIDSRQEQKNNWKQLRTLPRILYWTLLRGIHCHSIRYTYFF